MADTVLHDAELWEEFRRVVNMSSRELADWLRTCSASPDAEQLPDQAASLHRTLHISFGLLSRSGKPEQRPDAVDELRSVAR